MTALRYSNLNCPQCDGRMIHNGPYVSCTVCAHQEGRVTHADRQRANGKTTETATPRRNTVGRTSRKGQKARDALARIGQPDFEGRIIQPTRTYGTAKAQHEQRIVDTAESRMVQVVSKSRHEPCDRLYIVSNGVVVCPSCGTVDSTNDAVKMLTDAFNPTPETAA